MIFILLVVLFALVLSFVALALAPAKIWVRHQFLAGVAAPTLTDSYAGDSEADLPPEAHWTALDDQQLARFLKGSATP